MIKTFFVSFFYLSLSYSLSVFASDSESFVAFESAHVTPITLSLDKRMLYAVNTPDNRLEIFSVKKHGLKHLHSIPVGMEPVSVAVRNRNEVWVVNHLSDSVSIVRFDKQGKPYVKQTLLVGDEPRDIVFAGRNRSRAFITTAHRGQNVPYDPQLKTASVGRADIWVFNANNVGDGLTGDPLTIIQLFGDTPRALAVNKDGSKVFAAIFHSGNQTTTIQPDLPNGGLDKPSPQHTVNAEVAAATGLIVKFDGTDWIGPGNSLTGEPPKVWSDRVRFSLPDKDVFVIDANSEIPRQIASFSQVGTTLFNMAVHPVDETIYISNTEALNHKRFEGDSTPTSKSLKGNFIENRITIIKDNQVEPRNLNKHIASYDQPVGTLWEKRRSLSIPTDMVISDDGKYLYLAAFGSNKIARYKTKSLNDDSFKPKRHQQLKVSGGGPSGLALDSKRNKLYVMTRFDNGISVIDTKSFKEVKHYKLYNPEPASIIQGRKFLYNANLTSSRGDVSCASCHVFGDLDHLAWDLGNPNGAVVDNPNPYVPIFELFPEFTKPFFNPMKGPMTTQSLRGLRGNGPMHWRGDRTGASRDANETLEEQAFEDFNVAFSGLLGREEPLRERQMQKFTDFALQLTYPPSPIRRLDNSLTPSQSNGRTVFMNELSTGPGLATCNDCHTVDEAAGNFGTSGGMAVEGLGLDENFKTPHLRNLYQKVGMFGSTGNPADGYPHTGDQIRGFGYMPDGSIDTVSEFLTLDFNQFGFSSESNKQDVVDFALSMVGEMAPIVGQQVTLSAKNYHDIDVHARIDLMIERARVTTPRPECDLVVKAFVNGKTIGAIMLADGRFITDRYYAPEFSDDRIRGLINEHKENTITYTCAPPGSGIRMGIDRNEDGILDGDEKHFKG